MVFAMTQKIYRLDKTRPVFEQETFSTKQEVIDACFNADPSDPVYRDFAAVVGLDEATIATGSIVTTAYNKDLLRRRVEAREGQLRFFSPAIAGPKELGLKYSISPALHMAFTKASSTHDPSLPFRVTVSSPAGRQYPAASFS